MPEHRSLPPMEAIEFAIEKPFRHFFFALELVIGWAVVLLPLIAFAWYAAFRAGMPDMKALPPLAMVALGLLCLGVLLASFSIGVNWNRRILLDERPRFLMRWRLDGVVWRYLGATFLLLVVLGVYTAAGLAVMMYALPAFATPLGAAAKPLGIAATVLIGLSGLFTFYRLMSWLAATAASDGGYGLAVAWRTTGSNRVAFVSFTFWLLFSLGIAGAVGAGAFFAQQSLPQPWVKPVAFAVMALVAWLSVLMLHTIPAALYRAFR